MYIITYIVNEMVVGHVVTLSLANCNIASKNITQGKHIWGKCHPL